MTTPDVLGLHKMTMTAAADWGGGVPVGPRPGGGGRIPRSQGSNQRRGKVATDNWKEICSYVIGHSYSRFPAVGGLLPGDRENNGQWPRMFGRRLTH